MRGIVPIEAGSRLGLLEADVLRWFAAGHGVEGFKPVSFDLVHVKMRLAVVAGEEANELDQDTPATTLLRRPNTFLVDFRRGYTSQTILSKC
jgi:hypothetical protein